MMVGMVPLGVGPALADGPETETVQNESSQTEEESELREDGERLSVYEDIEVRERVDDLIGTARSASEGSTGRQALQARPIQRSGEIVETVPGLIATQHSGDGKANQYFLRGFNLDHGTDFSIHVDGMPVNLPSHGHGQGYADLNFLIPELVDRVRFHKGIASASGGDFSAAGSARIGLVDELDRGLAELTLGSHGYGRVVVAGSSTFGSGTFTGALEVLGNDGPWERPNDAERVNGLLRYVAGDASRGWAVTAMGYDGSWLSTDQIPQRAVEQGLVGRFGLVDPGPRGDTQRYSLSGSMHRGDERSYSKASAYTYAYDFGLISNFTYFLDESERGDQFEQADERWVSGFDVSHHRFSRLGETSVEWGVGLQGRYDDIENGLYRTESLQRFATVREDSIEQWGLGPYSEVTVRWPMKIRSTFGLRFDHYDASVTSDLGGNSGSADDSLLSPKVALAFGPWRGTEFYTSWGYGFHSNDARGATIRVDPTTGEPATRVEPLVRAEGFEVGLRSAAIRGLQTTLTLHRLDLDSELVFVGDGGATEASRPSRRIGIEWTNAWQLTPSFLVDLDVAWVDAEFTDEDPAGSEIPGALETVVTGGFIVEKGPWSGALRLRAFGDYPLIEDGSVRAGSSFVLNARLAYALSDRWLVAVEGFNLLDRDDSDVEYFYASRLPGEPEEGIEDVHFHPVEGPAVRLRATYRF